MKFKNLSQKKTTPATNSPAIATPPVNQVPQQTVDPIVEQAKAIMAVDPNMPEAPLLDKHKVKGAPSGHVQEIKEKGKGDDLSFLSLIGCGCQTLKA